MKFLFLILVVFFVFGCVEETDTDPILDCSSSEFVDKVYLDYDYKYFKDGTDGIEWTMDSIKVECPLETIYYFSNENCSYIFLKCMTH